MARPIRTASGKWRINMYMGRDEAGKRIYRRDILDTRVAAQRLIAQLTLDRDRDKVSDKTVRQAMDSFIDSVDAIHSPSTVAGYRQLSRNAFKSIESIRLSTLKLSDIQAAANMYAASHRPKTVRNAYGFLNRCLVASGHAGTHGLSLPRKSRAKIMIPSDAELVRVLDLAEDPRMHLAILLAASAGMRRSEIVALEWQHVDFGNQLIIVEQAMVKDSSGNLVLKTPKTASSVRQILVGEEILEGFRALINRGERHPISLTPDAVTRRFERLRARAGVRCRYHDLRHYQASLMLAEGIPDKYAMERMGHSSTNMLRSVYQHTLSAAQRQFSDKLNTRISQRLASARKQMGIDGE